MIKVVNVEDVKSLMAMGGWRLSRDIEGKGMVFIHDDQPLLCIERYKNHQDVVPLEQLLQRSPDMRSEFVNASFDFPADTPSQEQAIYSDLYIQAGQSSVEDLKLLFKSLSELVRVAGGSGMQIMQKKRGLS